MDQQSNMGGFNPLPNMDGANNGFQAAPAGNVVPQANSFGGAAPVNPVGSANPVPAPNQPVNPPMMNPVAPTHAPSAGLKPEKERNTLAETLVLVGVCVIAAAAIVFAVVFFMQYNELKTNFDSQKTLAVNEAVKAQQDKDEAAYEERAKEPYYSFTGPSDYGSISFEYPKTWSVYVEKDGNISGVNVTQSLSAECDREVMRVLNMMPQWKPGIQNDRPCRTKVCIPVVFRL